MCACVCFLRWPEHRTSSLKRQNQLLFEIDCRQFFKTLRDSNLSFEVDEHLKLPYEGQAAFIVNDNAS